MQREREGGVSMQKGLEVISPKPKNIVEMSVLLGGCLASAVFHQTNLKRAVFK